ncbi:hypothetical protein [Paenibacillus solani]
MKRMYLLERILRKRGRCSFGKGVGLFRVLSDDGFYRSLEGYFLRDS